MPITYTSGEQVEVYRFNWLITLGVPATALFLQAWLPHQFPSFALLDLPLLVTIFFAISRRNPISGLLTGRRHWRLSGRSHRPAHRTQRNRQDAGRLRGIVAGREDRRRECGSAPAGDARLLCRAQDHLLYGGPRHGEPDHALELAARVVVRVCECDRRRIHVLRARPFQAQNVTNSSRFSVGTLKMLNLSDTRQSQ